MTCWLKSSAKGYEVSDDGQLRSVDRVVSGSNGRLTILKGKILKTQVDKCGYVRVRVSVDGIKSTLKLHREVALAFIPNPNDKPQVNHINGNKQCNSISNLEWCDNSENQKHAVSTGLKVNKVGKEAARARIKAQVPD